MRRSQKLLASGALVGSIAVGLFLVGAVGGAPTGAPDTSESAPAPGRPATLAASITAAQKQLKATPQDARLWASLSLAYVSQAKATVDPSYYPKAEGAVANAPSRSTARRTTRAMPPSPR